MILMIQEVSSSIMELLKEENAIDLHSSFNNGINIKVKDRLIFLGNQKGPSAIYIPKDVASTIITISSDKPIIFVNNRLIFKEIALTLDFSDAQIISYDLKHVIVPPHTITNCFKLIYNYNFPIGLNMSTQTFLDTILTQPNLVSYLMGRGQGLTPSGDDILVGMLSYHMIHPYLTDTFINKIHELIGKKVTTDISINYLKDALNGLFSQQIMDLYLAMAQNKNIIGHLYNISNFGASSGKDLLCGIALGIKIRQNDLIFQEG